MQLRTTVAPGSVPAGFDLAFPERRVGIEAFGARLDEPAPTDRRRVSRAACAGLRRELPHDPARKRVPRIDRRACAVAVAARREHGGAVEPAFGETGIDGAHACEVACGLVESGAAHLFAARMMQPVLELGHGYACERFAVQRIVPE